MEVADLAEQRESAQRLLLPVVVKRPPMTRMTSKYVDEQGGRKSNNSLWTSGNHRRGYTTQGLFYILCNFALIWAWIEIPLHLLLLVKLQASSFRFHTSSLQTIIIYFHSFSHRHLFTNCKDSWTIKPHFDLKVSLSKLGMPHFLIQVQEILAKKDKSIHLIVVFHVFFLSILSIERAYHFPPTHTQPPTHPPTNRCWPLSRVADFTCSCCF